MVEVVGSGRLLLVMRCDGRRRLWYCRQFKDVLLTKHAKNMEKKKKKKKNSGKRLISKPRVLGAVKGSSYAMQKSICCDDT
jgi:hypothetical protein